MGLKEIKQAIDALTVEQLETAEEKRKREAVPAKRINLTVPLALQIVDLVRQGKTLKEIKREIVEVGPQGQKWKLTREQIQRVIAYRNRRYARLTTPDEE